MSVFQNIRKMYVDSRPVFYMLAGVVLFFALLLFSMLWGILGHDSFKSHTSAPVTSLNGEAPSQILYTGTC
jgi:hypothetical protein